MKRIITLYILLLAVLSISAQEKKEETTKRKAEDRFAKTWRIDRQFAVADTVSIDSSHINYNVKNLVDKLSIANSYSGNYGSPIQSKIFSKRIQGSNFMFEDGYVPYLTDIRNAQFYDVNFPFTNLTYITGGPDGQKEEQVKFLFTASPSAKVNFGLNLDYLYSAGMYRNQAAQRFSGNIFGRYNGTRYSAYGLAAVNNHFNHDNGGLTNLTMLNNPNVDVATKDMPTAMHGYSVFRKNFFYYNHSYSLGFQREVKVDKDSSSFEFVPVTRFGHVIQFEEMKKRYYEPSIERNFYKNTYDSISKVANDTAALRTLTNLFSINLAEEFNRKLKFGVTGYVENEIQQFTYRPDTTLLHDLKSNTRVCGVLSKNRGDNFRYHFLGDIYLIGYKLGEFRLEGKATGNFKLFKEKISLSADAYVRNETPSFFLQNYTSTHFRWANDFSKIYKTHVGGVFELPKRKTKLTAGVDNLTNVVYFNEEGIPMQHDGNVQVLSVDLKQDFKLKSITLENNAVYQLSSEQSVLPLPTFVLYHNLYYSGKWFEDLYPQFGINMRYYTKYFAPSYMPATGQFFNQNKVQIGNYPEINVYANFHLKTARFFLEYKNIGSYFVKDWGYSMPNYPINPPMFKLGLLWNFFN